MSNKPEDEDKIRETSPQKNYGTKYTYGDYLTWDDGKRYELIDGEIYIMTPAPGRIHQKISGNLHWQFYGYLKDKKCEVYFAPFDLRLPEGNEDDKDILTVVQPDLIVVCDQDKLDERGGRGAPDLVVEILSPTSEKRDREIKKDLYERHGVREYWFVDYQNSVVEVYLLKNGKYGKPDIYSKEDNLPVSIFSDFRIDLKSVFSL